MVGADSLFIDLSSHRALDIPVARKGTMRYITPITINPAWSNSPRHLFLPCLGLVGYRMAGCRHGQTAASYDGHSRGKLTSANDHQGEYHDCQSNHDENEADRRPAVGYQVVIACDSRVVDRILQSCFTPDTHVGCVEFDGNEKQALSNQPVDEDREGYQREGESVGQLEEVGASLFSHRLGRHSEACPFLGIAAPLPSRRHACE